MFENILNKSKDEIAAILKSSVSAHDVDVLRESIFKVIDAMEDDLREEAQCDAASQSCGCVECSCN
jgi:hypothetical protein